MKIKLLFVLFLCLYLIIIGRLFFIQILFPFKPDKDLYLKTAKLTPERGKIYDVNNNPLVLNQNSYLLYLEPKKITDKLKLIHSLSESLGMEEASLEAKIDQTKDYQAITNSLSDDKKSEIEKMNLPGVGFEYQMRRLYPEASLSAHLIGFVGKDDIGEDIGYFGLEGYYNDDLKGMPGFLESERDIIGRPIYIGTQNRVKAEDGRDLVLTIDKTVQEIVKRKLSEGLEKYQAKQGCVIVADPYTMAIIALSCLPDYDEEKYYQFSENYFENPAISSAYEPGSIFKPLIMAAAINEKKVKPDTIMNEDGPVTIGDYTIRTWNDKYEGKITMTRILEKSSNVGMVWVGEKLGNNNIYSYLEKYGLGKLTGIDLQGEAEAYLKPKNAWYPIDYSTVTFGQGIAVTPIQMITAFSSLINGGNLLQPYVVSKIVSNSKENIIKPKIIKQVISKETSDMIKQMLVSTIDHPEAVWDKPKGYVIGGKTGTAQIAIAGHYDPSMTNASFIGFLPADKPKFIAMVILENPKSSQWASETAAPLFFDIAKELIVYYNISPTQ